MEPQLSGGGGEKCISLLPQQNFASFDVTVFGLPKQRVGVTNTILT